MKYYYSTKLKDLLRYEGTDSTLVANHNVVSLKTERSFKLTQEEWAELVDYPEIPEEDLEIRFLAEYDEPSLLDEYEEYAKQMCATVEAKNWPVATNRVFERHRKYQPVLPVSLYDSMWQEHWNDTHRELVNQEQERRRKERT